MATANIQRVAEMATTIARARENYLAELRDITARLTAMSTVGGPHYDSDAAASATTALGTIWDGTQP